MSEQLYVAISLDVEEEGLFGGRYVCHNPPVSNLSCLSRLETFFDRGVSPTLFCAWPVLVSEAARVYLAPLLPKVEIGAHLHHWNTPPLTKEAEKREFLNRVPARDLGYGIFAAKLQSVLEAGQKFCGKPLRSFRMGRWDLHRSMIDALVENGIHCDASVRPLHWRVDNGSGPNHFGAPADPYWIRTSKGRILEVPLTVIPLLPALGWIPPQYLPALRQWGALALLAVYHPLWLLKLTTQLHVSRGGKFLSLTWHSSEMCGGATPHLPTEGAVNKFLVKIGLYLDWLETHYAVSYVTMSQIYERLAADLPFPKGQPDCDWTWVGPANAI